ncbi:MAG: SpoIIE family protein phosphatase [Gemmatimonadaceae bacterium]
MNRIPTPARGTSTTLRALPKALFVGQFGADAEALARRVEAEAYLVSAAADADDALQLLRAERHDLVLLNVDVPGMQGGGAQFVETLRGDPELENVPVIVASASDDIDAIERCLERGADDYLPKVFGPAVLRARVSAALDRRRVRDHDNLRRDMTVARNIQRDFLPESLPVARGVELEAALHPARQVSGDFYDAFLLLPSGNLVLVVGDVCDKGVGAAMFMALFRSLIRASADPVGGGAIQMIGGRRTYVQESLAAATPADLLTRVAGFTNNYIARLHGRTNMFATVFLAVLDPAYGTVNYVNAGHEPALIIGPDGSMRELRPTGPALGMMPDGVFKAGKGTLEPGATLFAFTDGLSEARSPTGEVYGSERLRAVVRANATGSASELVTGVIDALRSFTRQAEPHDDLTLLAAKRTGG